MSHNGSRLLFAIEESVMNLLRKPDGLTNVIDDNTALVNLGVPIHWRTGLLDLSRVPRFEEGSRTKNQWVRMESINGRLFIDGKIVVLYFDSRQRKDGINALELQAKMEDKQTLHPNIMWALLSLTHMIPEEWGYIAVRKVFSGWCPGPCILFWRGAVKDENIGILVPSMFKEMVAGVRTEDGVVVGEAPPPWAHHPVVLNSGLKGVDCFTMEYATPICLE